MSALNSMLDEKPPVPQKRSYHMKPAAESHLDLLKNGIPSDVTFIVGPNKERVPCHQIFLKARSSVFEGMFTERWNQYSSREVPLDDVDPKIFKKFLEYVYAETFLASVSETLELLQIAHKYDVPLLVSKCENLLESDLTLENAVDVFQVARKYDKIQLVHKVGNLMATSLSNLQNLPSFSRVDKETLMYVLKRNDLTMKEVDLFLLAVQWAKNQPGLAVHQSLQDILPLIRFPLMTLKEVSTIVLPTGILSQSAIFEIFMYFGADTETKKSLERTLKFSTQRRAAINGDNQASPLTSVCVPLYSTDFDSCRFRNMGCAQLKECLEFDIGVGVYGGGGPFAHEFGLSSQSKIRNVAWSGVSFYCPMTWGEVDRSYRSYDSTREFRITLKQKRTHQSYEEIVTFSFVKAEMGKITNAEFDRLIFLDGDVHYCITVEDMTGSLRSRSAIVGWAQISGFSNLYQCRAPDMGNIQPHVTATIAEQCVGISNIRRNELPGFWYPIGYISPQLIYKIWLKEY